MSITEMIKERRSVRTFDGRSIEPEILQSIKVYNKGRRLTDASFLFGEDQASEKAPAVRVKKASFVPKVLF